MTTKPNPPSPARNMVCIHRAITRGLTVGIARGEEFAQAGFPDAALRQGFVTYLQALSTVLWAHGLGEDEIAFPALKAKLPAAPYDRLTADHQTFDTFISQMRRAAADLAGADEPASLAPLLDELRQVRAIWLPHIQVEEEHFSVEAFAAVMSTADQALLAESLRMHSQQYATPGPLTLPFTLFNLEAEDRAVMAATMSSMVTEQLIPKAWKAEWAPMQPFLLE